MAPRVAVTGAGYWGKNLVRNIHELGALAAVCDARPETVEEISAKYGVRGVIDFNQIIGDRTIDAVVIASPAARHYQMCRQALLAGKDVFVEKPLALRAQEGRELAELAGQQQRVLMVGHILEYHPAIEKLKALIGAGELGRIQYIYSSRLNLGKLRTEENILWSFAPHDISVILSLLNEAPIQVGAQGGAYLNKNVFDTTLTTCEFGSGVKAHIFVSWLHPFKEQKLAVIGDRKMAVFDDTQKERKLVLYSHRITWIDRQPVAEKEEGVVVPLPNPCGPNVSIFCAASKLANSRAPMQKMECASCKCWRRRKNQLAVAAAPCPWQAPQPIISSIRRPWWTSLARSDRRQRYGTFRMSWPAAGSGQAAIWDRT